jgi:hypothetical protein
MTLRATTAEWHARAQRSVTYSWLFEPLIADALGRPNEFAFDRPPGWDAVVNAYALAFAEHNVRWETLARDPHQPGQPDHITADQQNELIDMSPLMLAALGAYGQAVRTGQGVVESLEHYIEIAADMYMN